MFELLQNHLPMNFQVSYLYGFSIYSIQQFIFSTNKLQEIVGASELVEFACKNTFDSFFVGLLEEIDIDIKDQAAGNVRAVITVATEEEQKVLEETYENLPRSFLQYGDLSFVQGIIKLNGDFDVNALKNIDSVLQTKRNLGSPIAIPIPMALKRSQRTGGISALTINTKDADIASAAKQKKFDESPILAPKFKEIKAQFPKELAQLASSTNHIALIHADANGLGEIVKNVLPRNLKIFSQQLEAVTVSAVVSAIKQCYCDTYHNEEMILKIRPIVLGGDDITVIIDATKAFEFTYYFLKAFEEASKTISEVGEEGLTACSGIVFMKQKFPLHYSADLVEELCKAAKDGFERKKSGVIAHRVRNTFVREYDQIIRNELSFLSNDEVSLNTSKIKKAQLIDIKGIETLVENLEKLKEEDWAQNDLREYLSLRANKNSRSGFLWERILNKSSTSIREMIAKDNHDPDLARIYQLISFEKFIP